MKLMKRYLIKIKNAKKKILSKNRHTTLNLMME